MNISALPAPYKMALPQSQLVQNDTPESKKISVFAEGQAEREVAEVKGSNRFEVIAQAVAEELFQLYKKRSQKVLRINRSAYRHKRDLFKTLKERYDEEDEEDALSGDDQNPLSKSPKKRHQL